MSKSEEIRMFKNFRFFVDLLDSRVVHDHFAQHLRGDGVLGRFVEVSWKKNEENNLAQFADLAILMKRYPYLRITTLQNSNFNLYDVKIS